MLKSGAFIKLKRFTFERVAGSQQERQAAELIQREIDSLGAISSLEAFFIQNSVPCTAEFTVLEPYQRSYSVTCYRFSSNTSDEGLVSDFMCVGEPSEISLASAKGKVVLLCGRLTLDGYQLLLKAGVSAFLTMSGSLTDSSDSDLETPYLSQAMRKYGLLPGLNIRMRDGMELVRQGASKVKLTVVCQEVVCSSHNVIAEIPGQTKPDEVIALGAHYDCVQFSSGVYDNGVGCVTLLQLLEYFLNHPPERTLRFLWFGAEELGLLGSQEYLKTHIEERPKIRFMINVDLGGIVFGRDMLCISADKDLMVFTEYLSKELGFPIEPRYEITSGDCASFVNVGIPAVSFCRAGLSGSEFMHTRYDCIEFQSQQALENSIHFILRFTERLVNSAVFPVSRKVPDDIADDIDQYFQNHPASLELL